VSESGEVVRLASSRRVQAGDGRLYWVSISEKRLQARVTGAGYMAVQTKERGKRKTLYVHRLIAQAFIPKPPDCNEINHKDGNKTNNAIENLEWTTHSANLRHAYATGLHPGASMTAELVREIKARLKAGDSVAALAREFGLNYQAVRGVKSGRSWAWLSESEA
jgi:hypothetical protein